MSGGIMSEIVTFEEWNWERVETYASKESPEVAKVTHERAEHCLVRHIFWSDYLEYCKTHNLTADDY
jgi:hypothetical protein